MNNELIVLNENGISEKFCVNARDVWNVLDSKRKFANWFKYIIDNFNLVEDVDYCSFHKNVKRETGASTRNDYYIINNINVIHSSAGRPKKDFLITLELAKEIATSGSNKKSKELIRELIRRDSVNREKLNNKEELI